MFDFTHLDLNLIWFILIGVLFSGYAMLDGFDLGIGALHLLTRTDSERRLMINSIGPVWDGNEVWLVTGGGALFAAFPDVYATLASGFYFAVMLLLLSLIFRAVAIEFRSKHPSPAWRQFWDVSFSVSSILASLVLGIALGNLVRGVPLGADKEFAGTFWGLFNPYAVLVGITTVALFMMHGSIYAVLKTEGEFHAKVRGWVNNCIIFFIICYAATTMVTLVYMPHMVDKFRDHPVFFAIPLLNMLTIANIPREIHHGRAFMAIVSSCAAMLALIALVGIGIHPNIVASDPGPEHSLTIYNAASSIRALNYMLNIAVLGIPFVLAYTIGIYWIFRGKVRLTKDSY
ncbi:MAG: cytochrome d ubiquinol oxidase subunit II [Candidatus Omnitrophota bacterium]|nr:cytochrome d ubiquinol oxidase subunit II [Candidatus Omnitrophota bacterium]MDZ4243021.1 cytochrome d ubiquinol oxidase subunit II [Candidatus Omnitrophota bacterium]